MTDHETTAVASAVHSGFLPAPSKNDALSRLRTAAACQGTAHATAKRTGSFTLAELAVSMGVLVLLVSLATQLINSAATVTTLGHKQMDADSQARQVLDRMAVDFAQMLKRSDVDYYVKSSAASPLRSAPQIGNDQIAFYSSVPGYYPTPNYQSPFSLVAYRINQDTTAGNPAYLKLERMGKGLLWNGATTPSPAPVVFMPIPAASALPIAELPVPTPTATSTPAWPEAASGTSSWSGSEEVIGPQVFRFEYCYLLKGQTDPTTGITYAPILTDIPWDTRISSHTAPRGMQDVAAVVVGIAVIDPKSKVLLSDTTSPPQIAQVASQLIDWGDTTCAGCPTQTQWQTTPGLLRAQWRAALDANTVGLPQPAISGIRVYERYFYLNQ